MSIRFIEKNLAPEEQLLYRTQPHWIVFSRPVLLTMGLGAFAYLYTQSAMLVWLAVPIILIVWIAKLIEYICSEFAVTNKRVLVKIGLIQMDITDTLLQRIESVQISQSLLGKILSYGTVTICGTGGDRYSFLWIRNPMLFRSYVQQQMSLLGTA